MQELPDVCQKGECFSDSNQLHHTIMAPTAMGSGHRWALANGTRKLVIRSSSPGIFHQRVIRRFGVPTYITVDNGKQFDCAEFRSFCDELGIKLTFASVYHPESNGAVERANGLIFQFVSKSFFDMSKGQMGERVSVSSLDPQPSSQDLKTGGR